MDTLYETTFKKKFYSQIEEDWTLDGIHIGPLPFIQMTWKVRLMMWLMWRLVHNKKKLKFVDILRFDYVTNTMIVVPFLVIGLVRWLFFQI